MVLLLEIEDSFNIYVGHRRANHHRGRLNAPFNLRDARAPVRRGRSRPNGRCNAKILRDGSAARGSPLAARRTDVLCQWEKARRVRGTRSAVWGRPIESSDIGELSRQPDDPRAQGKKGTRDVDDDHGEAEEKAAAAAAARSHWNSR